MTADGRSPPGGATLRLELSSGLERELRIVEVMRESATGTLAVIEVLRPDGALVRGLLQLVPGSHQASRRAGPSGSAEVTTRRSWAEVGAPRERRRADHTPPTMGPLLAAASLESPALAPLLEFGALLDGGVYAISSLEQAHTLWELVGQRGPTGPATACRFTAAVGRAVSLLHREGLAHGGVGPAHIIVRRHGGGAPAVELTRLDLEAYSLPEAGESPPAQISPTSRRFSSPGGMGPSADLTAPDKAQDVDGLGRLLYLLLTGEATLPLVHAAEESAPAPKVDVAAVRRSVAAVVAFEQSGHAEHVAEIVLTTVGASEGNDSPWSAEDVVGRLEALYPSPALVASPSGDDGSSSGSKETAPLTREAPLRHSSREASANRASKRKVLAEQLSVLVLAVALILLGVVGYLHTNGLLQRPPREVADTRRSAEESAGSLGDSAQGSPISLPGVVVGMAEKPQEGPAPLTRLPRAPRPSAVQESLGARPPSSVAGATETPARRTQPPPANAPGAPQPASAPPSTVTTPPPPAADLNRTDLDVLVDGYAAAIESGKVEAMAVLYPGMSGGERRSWERFFSLTSRRTARLDVRERRQQGDSVLAVVEGEIRYLNQSLGTTDRRPVSFLGVFRPTSGIWRMIAVRGTGTGG